MTQQEFEERFPEFRPAGALIPLAIADAEKVVTEDVFGVEYEEALGQYAAHILATKPYGRSQRLSSDGKNSNYLDEYNRIKRRRVVAITVL